MTKMLTKSISCAPLPIGALRCNVPHDAPSADRDTSSALPSADPFLKTEERTEQVRFDAQRHRCAEFAPSLARVLLACCPWCSACRGLHQLRRLGVYADPPFSLVVLLRA